MQPLKAFDGYQIKNLRSCEAADGVAWSGTLYRDGKRIAKVRDGGNGGMLDIDWLDHRRIGLVGTSDEHDRIEAYVATLPGERWEGRVIEADIETFVAELADHAENMTRLKRHCRTKTLFRLVGDERGAWRTLKIKYQNHIGDYIRKKYGDDLLEILNETLRAGGA